MIGKDLPAAAAYLDLIRRLNPDGLRTYPGSPAIIAAFLRDEDRLIACELHEEEAAKLRRNFRGDPRVAVHHRDGYEAIGAFVPLPARRGLVFIDPPYEKDDREAYRRLAERMNAGLRKWPTGMFAAWYPLKDRVGIEQIRAGYGPDNPPTLAVEFLRAPVDGVDLRRAAACSSPTRPSASRRGSGRSGKELLAAFDAPKGSLTIDWWIPET